MPASASARIVSSRRGGVGARGSILRARSRSSVRDRDERPAPAASPPSAPGCRCRAAISADLVTMPTGWLKRAQHFQDAAGDPVLALDRLVGIGVGAHGDHRRADSRACAAPASSSRAASGFIEQLGLEIEPRRQPEIGMGRPREAVDAAMLAAAIGVDRAVEGDVRRLVAGDDGLRRVDADGGAQRRQVVVFGRIPAVSGALPLLPEVAADPIADRPAPLDRLIGQGVVGGIKWVVRHARTLKHLPNNSRTNPLRRELDAGPAGRRLVREHRGCRCSAGPGCRW